MHILWSQLPPAFGEEVFDASQASDPVAARLFGRRCFGQPVRRCGSRRYRTPAAEVIAQPTSDCRTEIEAIENSILRDHLTCFRDDNPTCGLGQVTNLDLLALELCGSPIYNPLMLHLSGRRSKCFRRPLSLFIRHLSQSLPILTKIYELASSSIKDLFQLNFRDLNVIKREISFLADCTLVQVLSFVVSTYFAALTISNGNTSLGATLCTKYISTLESIFLSSTSVFEPGCCPGHVVYLPPSHGKSNFNMTFGSGYLDTDFLPGRKLDRDPDILRRLVLSGVPIITNRWKPESLRSTNVLQIFYRRRDLVKSLASANIYCREAQDFARAKRAYYKLTPSFRNKYGYQIPSRFFNNAKKFQLNRTQWIRAYDQFTIPTVYIEEDEFAVDCFVRLYSALLLASPSSSFSD